jgi:4-alpha-glucanotransferase
MSTIRGWWEEDRSRTQYFYNTILGQHGEAPMSCEAWINRAIVLQHLYCPAMWSIFQLQDLLGMDENIRRENPADERINVPADPNHYWRYRMHMNLEDLIKQKTFNEELKGYVEHSGRAGAF